MSTNSEAQIWVGIPVPQVKFQDWVYDHAGVTKEDAHEDIVDFVCDLCTWEDTRLEGLGYSISYDAEDNDDRLIGLCTLSVEWGNDHLDLSLVGDAKQRLTKVFTNDVEDIGVHLVSVYF